MLKIINNLVFFILVSICVVSCSDYDEINGEGQGIQAGEIQVNGSIDHYSQTRVNDGGFVNGDAIGVYIVNYEKETPGELLSQGNHVTNMKFTYKSYNGQWEGSSKIYWRDKNTAVDAISYYPFREVVDNPKAMPIVVLPRQDKDDEKTGFSNYEASDMLWAKAENVEPGRMIDLKFRHLMAGVEVNLLPGAGFDEAEWDTIEKSIIIKNVLFEGLVDLSTGQLTTKENSLIDVFPFKKGNRNRAVILPQVKSAGETLFDITVNGKSYYFKRDTDMTFTGHKLHKFTIQAVKSMPAGDYEFKLIDEAITAWEDDGISHGGETRDYVVVNSPQKGGLKSAIAASGYTYNEIKHLKIIGQMNPDDFLFLRQNLVNIEALNLRDVKLKDGRYDGSYQSLSNQEDDVLGYNALIGCTNLKFIVFPELIKKIGNGAFEGTSLIGELVIPEGVTHIGNAAFHNFGGATESLGGMHLMSLSLPSTLEVVEGFAFRANSFNCKLILPEGLKEIGEMAFSECINMYGTLTLPSSLEKIGNEAFRDMKNITGPLIIPSGVKEISGLFGTGNTSVYLPEGLETIGENALGIGDYVWTFVDRIPSQIKGDLVVPSTVKSIGKGAFGNLQISHIYLPESIALIPQRAFYGCEHLVDTLHIPSSVKVIQGEAFRGCSLLDAIVLPENLETIGGGDGQSLVFEDCNNLTLLRCLAKKPPYLSGDVFGNLNKANVVLEVPEGAEEAYCNAEAWCDFKRITACSNFSCNPRLANVLNQKCERKIVLYADAGWTVSHIPSWCHISAMNGFKKTELTITIDELPTGQSMRQDDIIFKLNDKDVTTSYTVKQYNCEYQEDDVITLQNATRGKGIDLVLIGDGYDAKDIADGTYLKDMNDAMEYFFGVEPFTSYRDYFNVKSAIAVSEDHGIATDRTWSNSKFKTLISNTVRIGCDADEAMKYVVNHGLTTAQSLKDATIVLVPNTDLYEGVCYTWEDGSSLAVCPKSKVPYPGDGRGVLQHEAGGHAFAKFSDEYIYHIGWLQTCNCSCCQHMEQLRSQQLKGWGQNLSISGKYNEVPWRHLMQDPRYNDIVDIYEGGFFHSNGVFRSEVNSVMNNGVPYFSTWCRELIVRRIKKLAGETFSYEEFVANDSREWGRDFTVPNRAQGKPVPFATRHHGTPPIMKKGSPNLK